MYNPEQEGTKDLNSGQLQHSLSELAELNLALATSQQLLTVAQQQIEMLTKKCAQALHFAYHDELTGLPNCSLLMDRLKQAMAQSDRQQKQVALLFIDLDKFKSVNDSLGHAAGDELLQEVAKRLSACIRFGDTACRYGGDEFVIMLPEIDGQENAASVTEKIRAHLGRAYVLDGDVIALTASIGIAIYEGGGQNCSDLIKQADMSMYLAKADSNLPIRSPEPAMQN